MNESENRPAGSDAEKQFIEGVDYYFEEGLMVLTERYLLDRGYCCENGCRRCPYGFTAERDQSK
jgi:hypothetical protein